MHHLVCWHYQTKASHREVLQYVTRATFDTQGNLGKLSIERGWLTTLDSPEVDVEASKVSVGIKSFPAASPPFSLQAADFAVQARSAALGRGLSLEKEILFSVEPSWMRLVRLSSACPPLVP